MASIWTLGQSWLTVPQTISWAVPGPAACGSPALFGPATMSYKFRSIKLRQSIFCVIFIVVNSVFLLKFFLLLFVFLNYSFGALLVHFFY